MIERLAPALERIGFMRAPESSGSGLVAPRWWAPAVGVLIVALAASAPLLLNGFQLFIISLALCYAVATIGFNISLGWAGLLIFTGAAFFGIGGFVGGKMSVFGMPAELAILIAGLAGAAVGIVFGAMTMKLNHYYFAISGIAFMFILDFFYRNFSEITGGYSGFGIPTPVFLLLGNRPLVAQGGLYYVGLVLVILAYLLARYLERTPLGRGWRAVRRSPGVAESLGVNVWRSKLFAFTITSGLMAVAGAWFGFLSLRFLPETYMFRELIFLFLIVIVGGLGSTRGMIIGSIVLVMLREYLRGFPGLSELIYGVVLLGAVLFFSKGIYGALSARWRSMREEVL